MHSQQLLTDIKANLYADPQKCIKLLSTKSFLNNLFNQHLVQLTQLLQTAIQKTNKQNKGLSYATLNNSAAEINGKRPQQLNAQLIVCMYSIIIMKSTSKSIIVAEQTPIFNTKIAIQTLSKIHKQIKRQDVKKIVSALLLKIPTFSNHKNIIKDICPEFISLKTMQKASPAFRTQCPNLYEQKLMAHKNTEWGRFLNYKPLKLDSYAQTFKKLQTTGNNSTDANALIQIKEELKKQFNFLLKRIDLMDKEAFQMYEFCQKFSQLYKIKLEFSKLLEGHRFSTESRNQQNSSKTLPSYNLNQLRLKVLLEGKNQLLVILTTLVKKLSSYWTRKLKWLYDFIIERIEIFGLEELGLSTIQQPDIYVEKLNELKLLIKLAHTYYKVFGDGLFPEEKLKGILFTQQFSFYKLIQALLYNEYQFTYQPEHSRIVNYQKTKKVSQESKSKKNLIKTINVNSKSLNINPHYDLVFQRVIQQIAYRNGEAYTYLREIIIQALKFMATYYKRAETYFFGGNIITMIENCKNSEIPKSKILELVKEIKTVLYPSKKMTKQGLEFFCEEVFENYISKKRHLEAEQQAKNSSNFNICKTPYLTIHSSIQQSQTQNVSYSTLMKVETSQAQNAKGAIKKTKSYDMVIEGWTQEGQNADEQPNPQLNGKQTEMFYSIMECSAKDENYKKPSAENGSEMFQSFQDNEAAAGDEQILMPEF